MAPKKQHRYRSANGTQRPYRDGARWVAPRRLELPDGSTRLVRGTGATQGQARNRLEQNCKKALVDARSARLPGGDLSTVAGWLSHWLETTKRESLRYSTYVGYRAAIDRWIAPAFGERQLTDLRLEDVETLHAHIREAGLSTSTWRQVRTVLSQGLDLAVRRGHLTSNAAERSPHAGRGQRRARHLALDEARRVLSCADGPGETVRLLLALSLGLRQGEILALHWSDLELESSVPVVRIERTVRRQTGLGLVEGPVKTPKSRRSLHLPPELVGALTQLRLGQRTKALAEGWGWTTDSHVLASNQGTPIDPANDRKHWHRILQRAGVPLVNTHAARHTAASLMIAEGTDIAVVSSALGHASISTTVDIYGYVTRETVGAATSGVARKLTS